MEIWKKMWVGVFFLNSVYWRLLVYFCTLLRIKVIIMYVSLILWFLLLLLLVLLLFYFLLTAFTIFDIFVCYIVLFSVFKQVSKLFLNDAIKIVHTAPWSHYPNKNVFSDRPNLLYDKSVSFRCDGKQFHSPGPAAANALSPKVLYVHVITHVQFAVERSCRFRASAIKTAVVG